MLNTSYHLLEYTQHGAFTNTLVAALECIVGRECTAAFLEQAKLVSYEGIFVGKIILVLVFAKLHTDI